MKRRPILNRKMMLEAETRLPDGGGGAETAWVPLGSHWAELRPRRGRETEAGGRAEMRVTHELVVRAAPEGSPRRPKPDQRFRLGGRIFAIRWVAEADLRGAYLRCMVEEGALG